jgi:hypothetical protein
LEIFRGGYPWAFFFRWPEVEARRADLPYEEWEEKFLPLNGILGKVLNETNEHASEHDNLPFFVRYKENNPSKVVLLHYHGAGRRATATAEDFFAGHWLYYAGTNLTEEVDGSSSANVLSVADTSVFSLDRGTGLPDDLAIAPIREDGKPDWGYAEQIKVKDVDAEKATITVELGGYGTEPRYFPEASYLAAHVITPPYPSEGTPARDVPLWGYNFSTVGPQDDRGRNGADALVDYLVGKLGPGDPLEDVMNSTTRPH